MTPGGNMGNVEGVIIRQGMTRWRGPVIRQKQPMIRTQVSPWVKSLTWPMETCDAAVRRVLGVDPATWAGTLHVHCSGKTGELVFLSGALPAMRKRLPMARLGIVTVEHYKFVLDHLEHRFDESVLLAPRAANLADSVSLHNRDFRNGYERYGSGLIVNCYRSHAWHTRQSAWPRGPFYHAFAESVGITRAEFVRPGWGDDLPPRWGEIAVAFASLNQHSSKRRQIAFTHDEWAALAKVLVAHGLRPVATGHPSDPRPVMPGWEWIDGGVDVATTLAKESRFTVGGNSGITFLAGLVSRGPVVMVDEVSHLPLYDSVLMTSEIPAGKLRQIRINGFPTYDRMAFAETLKLAEVLP